ncbi:MAG: cell envelope integrity protein TolA [Pseudomonadota bacterium]
MLARITSRFLLLCMIGVALNAPARAETTPEITAGTSGIASSEMDEYASLIAQKVGRNWLLPQSMRDGLNCWMQVRLSPNGEVLVVRVVQSSGNMDFDRSAESAVYKASPLPVPQDDKVREFIFHFKPGR